jgi:hypothetical protein
LIDDITLCVQNHHELSALAQLAGIIMTTQVHLMDFMEDYLPEGDRRLKKILFEMERISSALVLVDIQKERKHRVN